MSIFGRLRTLMKSNVNDMISKAEDPQKILNQLIVDMRGQLVDSKKMVALAIADEKRLEKQVQAEREKEAEWERKAMLPVRAGKDELAMQALARKSEHENTANQLQTQLNAQAQATQQLRSQLHQLNSKIDEAQRKKNLLVARAKRAEAQKKIQSTMQGFSDTSAFDTFDRMAEKVDQMEAEAEAQAELAGDLAGDDLANQFKELEGSSMASENSLLELKAKMGLAAPQTMGSLPEGTNTN